MELTENKVGRVFRECLAGNAEDENAIVIDGITVRVAFDAARVTAHAGEIRELLTELPSAFLSETEGGGGGWSFLNACNDRHDRQWTGFHRSMEELFMIGEAAGMVKPLLPRELWEALPGSMPYYVISTAGFGEPA